MRKLRKAAEWMWQHRGKDIYWRPRVLTSENVDDPTNPGLNFVEAESVFRLLEEEKLIFPYRNEKIGATVYLINEVKEKEWKSFLKGINPFQLYVIRPLISIFANVRTAIIWFVSIVIASAVGAFFAELLKKIFEKIK